MAPNESEPTSPVEDSDAEASPNDSGSEDSAPASDEEAASDEEGDPGSGSESERATESPVAGKASATIKPTSSTVPADKTGGQGTDTTAPHVLVARTPAPGKPRGPRARPGVGSPAPAEAPHGMQEGSSTGFSRQGRDARGPSGSGANDAAVARGLHHAINPGHTLQSSNPPSDDEAPPDDDDTDQRARDRALATGRDAQEKRHRGQSTTKSDDDDAPPPLPDKSLHQKAAAEEAKKKETKKGRRTGVQFDTEGRTAVEGRDEVGDERAAAQKKARDERARKHISTIGHEVDAQQERQQEKARGTRFADEDQTPADQAETRDRLRDLKSSKPAKAKKPSTKNELPPSGPSEGPKKDNNDKSGKGGAKPPGSGHVPTSGFETHGW